jgi:diguanylate cyclase (GGDEF)-like protein/PAS domain S-box-containing protein
MSTLSAQSRSELLMRTTTEGLHLLDEDGYLLESSDAFNRMLGYDRRETPGLHVSAWDPNWNGDKRWDRVHAADGAQVVFEAVYLRKDARPVPVEVFAALVRHGGKTYVCASSHHIGHRKRIEDDLRMSAAAFDAGESMFIMDAVRRVVKVNPAFTRTTGFAAEETMGRLPPVLRPGLQDAALHQELWRSLRRDGHWTGEMYSFRKNGEIYLAKVMLSAVTRKDGQVSSYVGIEIDITRQKQAEEEAVRLAYYDSLTSLPNRRLLAERVQHALRRSARTGRQNALLFLDLDNFKNLNDTLGHEAGDQLLIEVAERLLSCLRESDTVARLAGDEFVIVLEDLDGDPDAAGAQVRAAAAKVQASLNRPFSIQGWEHACTPSIGIVLFGTEITGFEELLKHADVAMYHAKAEGRNTVRAWTPGMQHPVRMRRAMSQAMRDGLRAGDFFLEYQAQFDVDGKLCGAEALARWRHPERGLISSGEFIPLAERSGLIVQLGAAVLEQACRQLARWESEGIAPDTLSVNVSAVQVRTAGFVSSTLALLEQYRIDPRRLTLEITETAGLGDLADAFHKLQQVKQAGVRLALDDFGVGHASLAYLRQLPFDQIKIDKGFVGGLPDNERDRLIADAILALGERMGVEVVAEGVESEAQYAWLLSRGCRVFQGYLFSAPLEAEAFCALAFQKKRKRL